MKSQIDSVEHSPVIGPLRGRVIKKNVNNAAKIRLNKDNKILKRSGAMEI